MNKAISIGVVMILLGFLHKTCGAQERLLQGRVVDAFSSAPLRGAHVTIQGRAVLVVTDSTGRFNVAWDRRAKIMLRITHVGHAAMDTVLQVRDVPHGGELHLALSRSTVHIPEVVIRRNAVELVYQRQDLHVGGYLPAHDGLWVLVYEKPGMWHAQENAGEQVYRNARLHLLDTLFNEIASRALPTPASRLHADHQGRPIVEGARRAWRAGMLDGGIALESMDHSVLHKAVLPWTDSIPGLLLGSSRSDHYPAFDHIALDPIAQHQHLICSVEDGHVMELFRSQYKYMSGRDKVIAMDLEISTGFDREVIAGYMTGFQHDVYFRVPYAPLFVVDDTLCVFDHSLGVVRRFTSTLAPCGELPMMHPDVRGWRGRLLQDPVSGQVYAVYAHGPHSLLRRVDASTGAVGSAMQLSHLFPEELQVFDGYAYYVYRPYGSTQRRSLYREPLLLVSQP